MLLDSGQQSKVCSGRNGALQGKKSIPEGRQHQALSFITFANVSFTNLSSGNAASVFLTVSIAASWHPAILLALITLRQAAVCSMPMHSLNVGYRLAARRNRLRQAVKNAAVGSITRFATPLTQVV